ncbi:MAG: hypothetical protein HY902_20535, partial [Deltaproteobacteria bacterium]|nr:hypothetical protein [Deltaproteobacteria bacterium]
GCSANFNNGNTYECPPNFTTLGVSGALTSPILNGSSVPAGSKLWVSAWLAGDFGYDDKVELQGSTDGSTWVTIRSWDADQLFDTAWRQFIDPLDDYVGTSFQLRWKFTGGDCYQNNKLGVFIDDVSVYVAPPCAQGEPYNTAEVIPAYTMGASLPYKLDPPLYTGSTNQVAKASWHVAGVPNKFVTVKVEFSGAGQASVCVQHVCDGSPPCSIACPAGTYANATKTGCCTSNVDSDTITFTPTGSGANSGTTTVFAVATAPVCQEVQVKAKF